MKYINSNTNKRYYTYDYFLKQKFKCKVFKINLNAGFSCPNKDGTLSNKGCIYCHNGSGDFAGNPKKDLITQFNEVKSIISKNTSNSKYIAYFGANTNTYAPLIVLKQKYETVLEIENVVGLSISTRPDCISDELLNYLEILNKKTFLTIELGLQTIHEQTSILINRCHSLKCFEETVKKLKQRNINTVVHIINSLPYETKEQMLETVNYLNKLKIDGIKIHMLNIMKNTEIANMYNNKQFSLLTKQEYINIICDQIENLNENIVIHRISSDPDKENLIAPLWLTKKFDVMNEIDKELARRNTFQGFNHNIFNKFHTIIDGLLKEKDIVIDATIGNGNDTVYLAKAVPKGFVFGFDIQDNAINNTTTILNENNINNYKLFKESHENIDKILSNYYHKISLIVYNLGYLPKGNKQIMTTKKVTVASIKNSIKLLNNKGTILIIAYPHKEGLKEATAIKNLIISGYVIKEYHNTDNKLAPYLIEISRIRK